MPSIAAAVGFSPSAPPAPTSAASPAGRPANSGSNAPVTAADTPCKGSTSRGLPCSLDRYAIRLLPGGRLEVDRSRLFRIQQGEPENPESYVEV